MSFDYAQFIAVYPEFSDIPQATVEFKGNLGDKILSDTSWGDVRDEALFLWTAHRLALEYNIAKALKNNKKNSINPGLVNSQSASNASLSNSYSHSAMVSSDNPMQADYARTSYGLEFLSLMNMVMPAGYVVISGENYCCRG